MTEIIVSIGQTIIAIILILAVVVAIWKTMF